ncbi:hypothetical protein J6590_066962 [Homalodisca vitripennis]|nr:hypothetical protein J6590_066962 [Homalodisca vitripennis]
MQLSRGRHELAYDTAEDLHQAMCLHLTTAILKTRKLMPTSDTRSTQLNLSTWSTDVVSSTILYYLPFSRTSRHEQEHHRECNELRFNTVVHHSCRFQLPKLSTYSPFKLHCGTSTVTSVGHDNGTRTRRWSDGTDDESSLSIAMAAYHTCPTTRALAPPHALLQVWPYASVRRTDSSQHRCVEGERDRPLPVYSYLFPSRKGSRLLLPDSDPITDPFSPFCAIDLLQTALYK